MLFWLVGLYFFLVLGLEMVFSGIKRSMGVINRGLGESVFEMNILLIFYYDFFLEF